ncbi:hypothetical protein QM646_00810 [Rhodococcus erythropolis]|nr:hypothetical protein [Rhodococcus erythropolis]
MSARLTFTTPRCCRRRVVVDDELRGTGGDGVDALVAVVGIPL